MAIHYYLKALGILEPWIVQIALSDTVRVDVLTEEKIEELLEKVSSTESNLCIIYSKLNDWDKAQNYFEQ
jgi:hypothetical protein